MLPRGSEEIAEGIWETPIGALVYRSRQVFSGEFPEGYRYGFIRTWSSVKQWFKEGGTPLDDYYGIVPFKLPNGALAYAIWDTRRAGEPHTSPKVAAANYGR